MAPSRLGLGRDRIQAPPDEVWPWLVQMGSGRAGFHTHECAQRRQGWGRGSTAGADALVGLTERGAMALLQRSARRPLWSEAITRPLVSRVPLSSRRAVLVLIKLIHTAAFFSISAMIGIVVWDGFRRRPRRRTLVAALVAVSESAVYGSNNLVCPLTPLAEELGASRGTVTDIYLPRWLSLRVPLFGGGGLVLGVALNLREISRRRRLRPLAEDE